jgi:undecaprenyl pyrophosphate phosphatase UppP
VMYTLLLKSNELSLSMPASTLLVGVASSAVFGFLAIRFLLGVLRRTGFGVFALYRVLVAFGLFAWSAAHR